MAFIERETVAFADDAAIAALQETFAAQRKAFLADPFPPLQRRLELLGALAAMMVSNRGRIQEALAADFGSHPPQFADVVECLGVAARAQFVAANLAEWMKPQPRATDPAVHGTAKAYVQHQPKGVIGNMAPWNFPFDIGFGPLAEMLGAGNRVIIKPSDLVPACSELTQEMVAAAFDPTQVAVVTGGLALAKTFPTLRWDHLMYTGGTEVGRSVAVAAAQNLVPVTLELGGKCPALVAPDAVDESSVAQIVGCKQIKNGQMCVTVDYVLVPEDSMERFADIARRQLEATVPDYVHHKDGTGIINRRHLDRLLAGLDDARAKGATLVSIGGEVDRAARRMPFTLVLAATDDMLLMRDEIFGPILPIVGYRTLDDAIAYINGRARPLGIYVFTRTPDGARRVLERTVSGGACVNAAAMQAALPSLPFGGIGDSGSGRHHGYEGFLEFSNARAVFERGTGDVIDALYPPYGEFVDGMIAAAFAGAGQS